MTEVPYSMRRTNSTLLGVYHLTMQMALPRREVDNGVEELVQEPLGRLRLSLRLVAEIP